MIDLNLILDYIDLMKFCSFLLLLLFSSANAMMDCVHILNRTKKIEVSELSVPNTFLSLNDKITDEKKYFFTQMHLLGYRVNAEGSQLKFTERKRYDRTTFKDLKGEMSQYFFDQMSTGALSHLSDVNQLLSEELPDPGMFPFEDWTGNRPFRGNIETMMEQNIFKPFINGKGNRANKVDLTFLEIYKKIVEGEPLFQDGNWLTVARIDGKDSKSPISKKYPNQKTERQHYWNLDGDPYDPAPTLQSERVRVAVNLVNGVEKEAEVFVKEQTTWFPLVFIKENGRWVRKTTIDGEPILKNCIKCHSTSEGLFGPTPKLKNYVRPPGWFEYEVPIHFNSEGQADEWSLRRAGGTNSAMADDGRY